ncbi:MAG: carboxypeptidase-like regulatory domain-containing protein [Bacteroidia bacterium]|nr:carboxypeptidase-like regulatory domain-containing protein [Bacteroidia bacterium]
MAQTGVKGIVTNEKGDPLPYVTIYCNTTKTGTNTNVNGEFKLNLPEGNHQLTFQSIDYQSGSETVIIQPVYNILNITLKTQVYALREVKISANGQNPAIYIMRKAIAAAPYYRRQILNYTAHVYIKGSGKLDKIPFLLKPSLKQNNLEQGKVYVSESITDLSFYQPNTYIEKVRSVKTSMPLRDGPEPMMMVRGSLYSTGSNEVISPLSPQAFSVYEFILQGSFYEDGREINKIKVKPRRKGKDLYEGDIYIVEGLWCLHSCMLINKSNSIAFTVKTSFKALTDYPYVWVPVTYDLSFAGSYMGIEGTFRYLAALSNYRIRLNPNVEHLWGQKQSKAIPVSTTELEQPVVKKEKTKNQKQIEALLAKDKLTKIEMLKLASKVKQESERETQNMRSKNDSSEMIIDSLALEKDSAYWNLERTVPLLKEENISYALSDTISRYPGKSLRRHHFSLGSLLFWGDSMSLNNKKNYWSYTGILYHFNVNTVDGWNMQTLLAVGNIKPNAWRYEQQFKIPFERKAFLTAAKLSYHFAPLKMGYIVLSGGTLTRDFNEKGISPLINSLQLLIFQNNYLKLYQHDYVSSNMQFEPVNGLIVQGEITYANRYPLDNTGRYVKKEGTKGITNNEPDNILVNASGTNGGIIKMPPHKSLNYELHLICYPFQKYRIKHHTKQYFSNPWPVINLQIKGGVPDYLNSKSNFTQIEFGIAQEINLRHWVQLKYQVNAGKFTNSTSVYFPDYQHFAGNQSVIYTGTPFNRFQALPYYAYSTVNPYLQAFTQLDFKRLLLKRLPYLNLTRIHEQLFVNVLNVQGLPVYTETGYRLSQIAELINISVYAAFSDGIYKGAGVRLSVRLPL